MTLLHDDNPDIRLEAATALRNFRGVPLIEACLKRLMQEENLFVRGAIAETLRLIGDARILEPFMLSLRNDPHWYIRAIALKVLDQYGDKSVETYFVQALRDEDLSIQGRAADVLDKRGWEPPNPSEKASYFAAKQDWNMVIAAGAEAVIPLLELLHQQNDFLYRSELLKSLRQICSMVERIVFGNPYFFRFERSITLYDFETSTFTIPLPALAEIHIFPEQYDLEQVERFITYAINFIGQTHLKKRVEVHIHGSLEQLHRNLLNTFRNLCKHIEFYE